MGGFKNSGKIVKLKYYRTNVLGNDGDNFQDKLLKMLLIMKTRMTKIV